MTVCWMQDYKKYTSSTWYIEPGSIIDIEPGSIFHIEPGSIYHIEPGSITNIEPGSITKIEPMPYWATGCNPLICSRGKGVLLFDLFKVKLLPGY